MINEDVKGHGYALIQCNVAWVTLTCVRYVEVQIDLIPIFGKLPSVKVKFGEQEGKTW